MLVTQIVNQLMAAPRLQGRTALPILVQKTIYIFYIFNLIYFFYLI